MKLLKSFYVQYKDKSKLEKNNLANQFYHLKWMLVAVYWLLFAKTANAAQNYIFCRGPTVLLTGPLGFGYGYCSD